MTFMNQALLWGAAASLIPLVIHILNRNRFRTVEWGAMHLLESVIRVNHKRFRLDQLILLLVRCSIPLLLAFCLARPVLTGTQGLEGESPVSIVILLDNSYSMETNSETGTRFEKAVEAATRLIGETSRGSEIAVILTGGIPTRLFDEPVFDSDVVIQKLSRIEGGMGASDMQAAVDEALVVLAGMSHARRECIILSDFQNHDWEVIHKDTLQAIRRQFESLEIVPELSLMQLGKPVQENISVDSLSFPRRALGVGQRLDLRANLRNHGPSNVENVRVIFRIDGVEDSVTQLQLAPSAETQVLFPGEFKTPGSHVVEVEAVTDDPLQADNRFAAAVTVWENIKVLLVDGAPSSQPLQGETDYLSVALTPLTFGRVQLLDLVETETIQVKELDEERLKKSRVVVLANVSKLSDGQLKLLETYVKDGGAVLVCGGDQLDLNWYREKMFLDGQGLLPVSFGPLLGEVGEKSSSTAVLSQRFDHVALEFFNDPSNGDLSSATIRRWYQLAVPSEASEIVTLAMLDSGDPLLVEKNYGEGVVVQMATACDADWSDFPLRPVYVPMMQQLITTMASRISPPRNIQTGDSAVALIPDLSDQVTVSVVTPDGLQRSVKTVTEGTAQLARYEETQRPGLYTMSLPSTEAIHFVAETSRAESSLDLFDEKELAALADELSATVLESPEQYLKLDRLRRHGREVWKIALAALLGLLFLELILQQRFARVRA
ncbi:hypothetical protein Mal48_30810 [Thalassoglobus polymorphus]|uniref:VWFA domain-containing protein n=2 Tax=Thalassoglobus polymorphus TaxID=2527994 RepID=A0A517QQB9_9PLAN|nr:hypothetical protein Mal48_30810 [Thalassoglobus polymorphus]